ncbi:MAG: N-6 DNA methylase [Paludibacter sp.]|nr:N-6 DNA methylase [Paludibacter sp.]
MPLFQTSVINKHLKTIDKQTIKDAFSTFKAHFHNAAIQENIRNSKEEQYQEGFLNHMFVSVLGYTLNPTPNFNLTTEYKNVKDNKKADGAIVIENVVKAVVELKGTNTINLGNIEAQAFGYKNNQPDCVYVITSNFEKLRLYIDNAIEHIEFNLFTLTEKDFELLYLCLSYQSIEKGIPKKIKEESVSKEDEITKKLYRDYSLFKRELHQNIVTLNPEYDALTLFKKSQKLLDRFLFLFFAEDRQLLPPNSVRLILTDWKDLQERDENIPLYNRFKKYFGYLNTGYKGKRYDVFAYNGGLFLLDEVLDNVKIDDNLLYKHTYKLSEYDFESEVDVNILGHIFENSLNELDELAAHIAGHEIDKTKTKRKREGIVYTPKFITTSMIENTVGRLCSEKKIDFGIVEDDYFTDKKRSKKSTQLLFEKLKNYRGWLLQITICDPACGSGAFLNQALNFLIDEHRYIDELQAKLFGDALILSDIENTILENNLFGVDINEESVEIAKLSLWLRTARPNRKLNDLNNNIKCGNSLIDDPEVAGDKAFDWQKEFPQIFGSEKLAPNIIVIDQVENPDYPKLIKEKTLEAHLKTEQSIELQKEAIKRSEEAIEIYKKVYEYAKKMEAVSDPTAEFEIKKRGFDVVIGNPPYVRAELISKYAGYFQKTYQTYHSVADLFTYFYEKGFSILKPNGLFGFISNTFDKTKAAIELRAWLKNNVTILKYIDFTDVQIFEGATTYPIIFIAKNEKSSNKYLEYIKMTKQNVEDIALHIPSNVEQNNLQKENWRFKNNEASDIIKKLQNYPLITEKYGKTYYGIKTALNEAFLIPKNLIYDEVFLKPIYEGKELSKWINNSPNQSLILFKSKWTKSKFGNLDEKNALEKIKAFKPEIINHLLPYQQKAIARYDKGDYWWELRNCAYYHLFEKPKIIFPNLQNKNKFSLDVEGIFINAPAVMLSLAHLSNPIIEGKMLLAILNSKLIWYFLKSICVVRSGGYIEVKPQYFEQLPIPVIKEIDHQHFIDKANLMISLNKELQEVSGKFQRNIQRKFSMKELPAKLQNWYLLTYGEFIVELGKKKIKLSLTDEAEWENYFIVENEKAHQLKFQINKTDHEIDNMVYELYELTDEEIKIIEAF